ncbi:hypothetical protein PG990_001852 [Apiospora arundinis]
MPPQREASGDSASSTPSNNIPRLEKPIDKDTASRISRLRNMVGGVVVGGMMGTGHTLCNQIVDDIVSRDSKIIQQKIEVRNLQFKQVRDRQEANTLRKENDTTKFELLQVKLDLADYMIDNAFLINNATNLRQSLVGEQEKARNKAAYITRTREMVLNLTKEIKAWKDAMENLRLAESGAESNVANAGAANPTKGLPSHLLDRDIAQRIVDHYSQRATRSMQGIRKFLEHPEQESGPSNV